MLILDMSRNLLDERLVLVVKEECGDVQISSQATCPGGLPVESHRILPRECANNLKG